MILKILLIIWVINFVIRIFIRNYIVNDEIERTVHMYGGVTKLGVIFSISSFIMYILGLVIIIMAIFKF